MPFIGADGFCSPIGAGWESRVTSEFGYRRDPFTGETRGHTGMDLAVPAGTPVRAALPGTVTAAQYHSSYGYYVIIDHGSGLSTRYAHNSQLLVRVGQTVETGDIVSLSGSTGRSTAPTSTSRCASTARGQTRGTICRQQIEPPEEFQLRQAAELGILETRNGVWTWQM